MGLDITAYQKLAPAPAAALDEDGNPADYKNFVSISDHMLAWTEKEWPGRTAGLTPGVYSFAGSFAFRAGSYSGYNDWRDQLAIMARGIGASRVWKLEGDRGPFAELINFADNEGTIGPVVAAKLAKDFADFQGKAGVWLDARADMTAWFRQSYANWRKAFEMAADGGCVDFG